MNSRLRQYESLRVQADVKKGHQLNRMRAAGIALMLFPPIASLLAHDDTLADYEASLGSGFQLAAAQLRAEAACRLTIKLIDAETKKPLAGLVRITLPDGSAVALDNLLNRGTGLRTPHPARQWFALVEPKPVTVPRTRLQVEAFSGLETETVRHSIDLSGKSKRELVIALKRFHHAARAGWHSGNTHLHLMRLTRAQADEYLQKISRADGLELVFVSYLRRINAERNYISNTYSKPDLRRLSGSGVQFGNGEEARHNFGPSGEGYGHVMFLNIKQLIQPVSIGPGIMGEGNDAPALRRGIEQGRREAATVIWCHNAFGFEDVPDWVAGKLDALNIFDGGSRGGYEDTFYRYLNIGLRVPFSTGTDWFIYDFSRVHVRLDKPLTVENWLSALTAGKTFISNGPMLELRVGEHNLGDTIRLTQPGRLEVRAHGAGRQDFQQLELVQNGVVVQRVASHPGGGHFEAELAMTIEANEPGWIALRVSNGGATTNQNEMGEPLFAHTSPIYVEYAGSSVFKPEAARELIADMERSIGSIETKARFADGRERDEVLNVYREGIETLRRRLGK